MSGLRLNIAKSLGLTALRTCSNLYMLVGKLLAPNPRPQSDCRRSEYPKNGVCHHTHRQGDETIAHPPLWVLVDSWMVDLVASSSHMIDLDSNLTRQSVIKAAMYVAGCMPPKVSSANYTHFRSRPTPLGSHTSSISPSMCLPMSYTLLIRRRFSDNEGSSKTTTRSDERTPHGT